MSCNKSLRPRIPEGSLGRTAQDVHLDSHTAPELWVVGGGDGRFYIALFSGLEQTHCSLIPCDCEWMTSFLYRLLNIHRSVVYLQRFEYPPKCGVLTAFWISTEVWGTYNGAWCHVQLLPSRRGLCTPYNHAPRRVASFKATCVGCVGCMGV